MNRPPDHRATKVDADIEEVIKLLQMALRALDRSGNYIAATYVDHALSILTDGK